MATTWKANENKNTSGVQGTLHWKYRRGECRQKSKGKRSNEAYHVSVVLPSPSVVLEDCCCSPSEGAAVGATGGCD